MAGCRVTMKVDGTHTTSLSHVRYQSVPQMDWWRRSSDTTCLSTTSRSQSGPVKCSAKYFCLGGFLIFLGSVLLCAFGFTILLPHQATSGWSHVYCTVINASFSKHRCSCSHQVADNVYGDCTTKYPCLQIFVSYERETFRLPLPAIVDTEAVVDMIEVGVAPSRELGLYNVTEVRHSGERNDNHTIGLLYRSWMDSFYEGCSLDECGDEEWNMKESDKFRSEWGHVGSRFSCYVNPDNSDQLILWRVPMSHVLNAILWPALALTIGVFIWLGLCLGCWKIETEDDAHSEGGVF